MLYYLLIQGWTDFKLNVQEIKCFLFYWYKLHTKHRIEKPCKTRSLCLSSIFAHYILKSPPPTKIISSLHKIQIIGWTAWPMKPLAFDGWCESPEGSLLFWLVYTSVCLTLLLHEGPHPRAYRPRKTVDVLTCQSLFSNYFTHNGSHCAQSRSLPRALGI